MTTVCLRPCEPSDLDLFFRHMRDPEAVSMAAFTPEDPSDRVAFDARWRRLLADDTVIPRTILADGEVVGSVASFVWDGDREVTYWIDRAWWGRGIATRALALLLAEVTVRPIHARAAKDNHGSLSVLQRNGFVITGEGSGYAAGRRDTVEEYLLQLA
jgi:RimJ/RimL family protein N-acetyltransferase